MEIILDGRERILVDIVVNSKYETVSGPGNDAHQPYLEIFILQPNGTPIRQRNHCNARIGGGTQSDYGEVSMSKALATSAATIKDQDIIDDLLIKIVDYIEQIVL